MLCYVLRKLLDLKMFFFYFREVDHNIIKSYSDYLVKTYFKGVFGKCFEINITEQIFTRS